MAGGRPKEYIFTEDIIDRINGERLLGQGWNIIAENIGVTSQILYRWRVDYYNNYYYSYYYCYF